jgi:hypothetical protein
VRQSGARRLSAVGRTGRNAVRCCRRSARSLCVACCAWGARACHAAARPPAGLPPRPRGSAGGREESEWSGSRARRAPAGPTARLWAPTHRRCAARRVALASPPLPAAQFRHRGRCQLACVSATRPGVALGCVAAASAGCCARCSCVACAVSRGRCASAWRCELSMP